LTDQPTTAAFDRTERAGSPGLVLLFAACLVGPIAAFSVLPKDQAGTMVIGLLTILAVIGIFCAVRLCGRLFSIFRSGGAQ
jgi:two-component system cell cycle sensor histidine kinase/response regulator CckA